MRLSGARISFCPHNFFFNQVIRIRKVNGVHLIFTFAHLTISIETHYFQQLTSIVKSLRQWKYLAISKIESFREIPGHFNVLLLIFSNGDLGGLVNEDN